MSKTILIIDAPKNCEECACCVNILGKKYCAARGTHLSGSGKDCACPLVAVPERMDRAKARGAYDVGYIEGYNNCLSKITGGSNE